MSQENVEVVRRALDYLGETGDVNAACYDADIQFTTRSDGPTQTVYSGIDGLRQSLQSFRAVWTTLEFEAREFIEVGEAVVVPLLFRLSSRRGVQLDVEEGWAYWVRNGKIWRVEQHASKHEALEAAGLSE